MLLNIFSSLKTQVFQIHSNLVQLTFASVPFIWTQFWIIWARWKIRQNRSQAIMKLKHDAKNRMKTQVFQIHSNFVQLTNGRNRWHFCNFSVDPVFASKIDLWLGNQIDEFFYTNWVLYSYLVLQSFRVTQIKLSKTYEKGQKICGKSWKKYFTGYVLKILIWRCL